MSFARVTVSIGDLLRGALVFQPVRRRTPSTKSRSDQISFSSELDPHPTKEAKEEAPSEIEGYEPPTPGGWEGYPLDELAIRDERRTAMDVVRRIENNRFILDPEFQRDFVWDKTKQSRLIESILLRIPLPVFYVAEDA